jgi:hypothetical protein
VTAAKTHHKTARVLLLEHLDMHPGKVVNADLDPAEVGIVGDTAHVEGGDSYHLGEDQIRVSGHRYSVDESPRDQRGLDDYASAIDVGWFKVTTRRGTFDLPYFSRWLVALCVAGDPDTADLREVIYSPDGQVVLRWDRLKRRSSGDTSHRFHTHLSEHRDATGARMVRLVRRFLQHIGLIPEENTVSKQDVLDALASPEGQALLYSGGNADKIREYNTDPNTLAQVPRPPTAADNGFMSPGSALTFAVKNTDLLKALGLKLDDKVDAVLALLKTVAATIKVEATEDDGELAAVLARIDAQTGLTIEGVLSGLGSGMSEDQAAEMIRQIFGDRAPAIGQRLIPGA